MLEVEFVEAHQEPRHKTALATPWVRVLRVRFPPQDSTLFHRHAIDSFYIDLVDAKLRNEMVGEGTSDHTAQFGGISYKAHSGAPYIHRITCLSEDEDWFCLDGELLSPPPTVAPTPVSHPTHTLEFSCDRVRIYRINLVPGAGTDDLEYGFHGVLVALESGTLDGKGPCDVGDVWEILPGRAGITNTATTPFTAYVVELLG